MEKERREGFDGDRSSLERRGMTARWFRWKSNHEEWPGSVNEVRGSSQGVVVGNGRRTAAAHGEQGVAGVEEGGGGGARCSGRGKGKRRGMGRA
jgi:hypothetical protein